MGSRICLRVLIVLSLALPALAMSAEPQSARGEVDEIRTLLRALDARLERIEKGTGSIVNGGEAKARAEGVDPRTKAVVQELIQGNEQFVRGRKPTYFKPFLDTQKPRATVVTCADSRVHSHALSKAPDGDLFMVRNIGNQLATTEGSIEYGVHHLKTPLLLFVGHTVCGAIKAAAGDYSALSAPIKRELDTLKIPRDMEVMEGVITNVHNQVSKAMRKFDHEVSDGTLMVMGAVYDFRNDMGLGYGRLVVVNLNGETNAEKLSKAPLFRRAGVSVATKGGASSVRANANEH